MLTADDFIKSSVLQYLWPYRKIEGLSGMVGIGQVLRNRVLSGWHNSDWLTVLQNAASERPPVPLEYPDLRDPLFNRAVWKIESLFDGTLDDLSGGAKFWCVLSEATEKFKSTIIQQPAEHPRVANIGSLYFFA